MGELRASKKQFTAKHGLEFESRAADKACEAKAREEEHEEVIHSLFAGENSLVVYHQTWGDRLRA